MDELYKTYLHNPPHYFVSNAMYVVTGAILHNQPFLVKRTKRVSFANSFRTNKTAELEAASMGSFE